MINSMVNELKLTKASSSRSETEAIETIYFGGGTPSILSYEHISKLLNALHENYHVSTGAEITLEANPDDIDEIKSAQWKKAGINRLSVGVQSFLEEDLAWMNRAHNAMQALQCITLIKDAGFTNFSADLIYGTPTLSNEDWEKNMETATKLEIPHLSCYSLTIEPNTALQKMILSKKKDEVDPEKQAAQFLLLTDWLDKEGYEHYEISNFAKPGFKSRHNSSYWLGKPYTGIGPSAHSFNESNRRWNISNNALYIQSIDQNIIPYEEEILSDIQQLNEYIMTSIRTSDGIDLGLIRTKYGEEKIPLLTTSAIKYEHEGKLKTRGDRIILTKEGKLFADGITAGLFF